jgi:hypothetical protein
MRERAGSFTDEIPHSVDRSNTKRRAASETTRKEMGVTNGGRVKLSVLN